jgi:predicted nucleotidyltransferase
MAAVQTLDERKRARAEEIREGVARLRDELAEYGRTHGGRFWLYGSAVTGRIRYDSDIDVLVDFDRSRMAAAFDFLETACARLRLKLDAQPKAWCTPAFIDRIAPKALVLP